MVVTADTIVGIGAGFVISVLAWFAVRLISQIDKEIAAIKADRDDFRRRYDERNQDVTNRFHTLGNEIQKVGNRLESWKDSFIPERKQ